MQQLVFTIASFPATYLSKFMTQASTVLVLGANGRFGSACIQAFAAAGWRVLAQLRRPVSEPLSGVENLVTGDQSLTQALGALPRLDVVVHAMNPGYTNAGWEQHAPNLMNAAISLAAAHQAMLMFPGNVYNYGAQMPPVLAPDTPFAPTTLKGRIRVALEQRLQQAAKGGSVRGVVIRAGDFFGSGNGSWFDRLVAKDLTRGTFGYPGPLGVATPWAYVPDLAQAFVKVAQRRDQLAAFESLHFAGHAMTGHDWLALLQPIAQAQGWVKPGQALKTTGLPWPLIRLGSLFNAEWASLTEMRYLHQRPHALEGNRLAALCGASSGTPIAQAAGQALGELGLLSSPRLAAAGAESRLATQKM
jgi:nucleoside-diphosphate-sugar epimerase